MIKKRQRTNSETKEKVFLVVFLIFAIAIIILLFKAPTGSTILGAKLDKTTFNASEYIKGEVSLELEEGDLLPENMLVVVSVTRNITNVTCQTHYVCPNGKAIRFRYDNCTLIEDPESRCCKIFPKDCIQLLRDSDFDSSVYRYDLLPDWMFTPRTAQNEDEVGADLFERDENYTAAAFIDNTYEAKKLMIYQSLYKTPVSKFTKVAKCEDPDGTDTTIKGTCIDPYGNTCTDKCALGGGVTECLCSENKCIEITFPCPLEKPKCLDGVCVERGVECMDSDKGDYPDTVGSCTDPVGTVYDTCVGNKIEEQVCKEEVHLLGNPLRCRIVEHDCLFGCEQTEAGARCKEASAEWCDDPDGFNIFEKNICTDSTGAVYSDECPPIPIPDVDLTEYVCENYRCVSKPVVCPSNHVCQNGKCVATSPMSGECADSGFDLYSKGTCKEMNKIIHFYSDTCKNSTHVNEVRCQAGQCVSEIHYCPYGCNLGYGKCFEFEERGLEFCSDSDNGFILGSFGKCSDSAGGRCTDKCDPSRGTKGILECTCINKRCVERIGDCGYLEKCENGKCVLCTPNWQCSDFGQCICAPDEPEGGWGYKYRTCWDNNQCGTDREKPRTSEKCYSGCVKEGAILKSNSNSLPAPDESETLLFASPQDYRSLNWSMMYYVPSSYYEEIEDGCAFEIVVEGKTKAGDTRRLHYYYQISDVCEVAMPAGGPDRYIIMPPLPSMEEWIDESRDLYKDWTTRFGSGSETDMINKILLISHAEYDELGEATYAQLIHFDYIKLTKWPGEPAQECGKKGLGGECCLEGTGFGQYYGEQLSCPEGEECWSSCGESKSFLLKDFIYRAKPDRKYNRTSGTYTCVGCENVMAPGNYIGGEGPGYAACLDTKDSRKKYCYGWDNIYHFNLYRNTKLKTPAQNGTYFVTVQLKYRPEYEENEIIFYETSQKFNVGVPAKAEQPCKWIETSNWSAWSACDTTIGTKTRTRNCSLATDSPIPCDESNKAECTTETKTFSECLVLPACTEYDYELNEWCDDWTPSPCEPDETQRRTCEADINVCNDTATDAEPPVETRDCTIEVITEYVQEQKKAGKKRSEVKDELEDSMWTSSDIKTILDEVYGEEERPTWWIWVLVIVVIIAAAVLFLLLRLKKPKAKKAAIPAELLSYIKDAIAAGATKAEIASRLVQAGWPRESVDAAIKTLK